MLSAKRILAIRDLVPSPDPMSRVGKQDGERTRTGGRKLSFAAASGAFRAKYLYRPCWW